MTCIVALKHEDKVYMAGDRGASDDGVILSLDSSKIWKTGPYLIGYAGSMDGERMKHNFKPTAPNIKDTDKFMQTKFVKELREFYNDFWVDTSKDGEFSLIIGIRGEIYEHSSGDMSLSKYSLPYVAIGSGSEYAYGVLYATDKQKNARNRVNQAVSAAIKFNPSCMGPVDIISLQEYTYNMNEEFEEILKDIQNIESDFDEFEIWLENGIERGWITEPFCNTHEGDPYMTDEEEAEWEEGGDPCQVVLKIKQQ